MGISVLLFCLLGKDSVVVYHDQLDGEVLCYIYQAKYLFEDSTIPELMNGIGKNAMTAPAPLFIVFYKLFEPFPAFVVSQYFSMITAFVGMYLLLNKWGAKPVVAALTGVLFAYLPLLPVYGLSMYGIPLVIWAFIELPDVKKVAGCMPYYGCIVLFALSSSLILSGFAVCAVVIVMGLVCKRKRSNGYYIVGACILIGTYILCNIKLFGQVLGFTESYVTHKEEFTIAALPFVNTAWNTFINGGQHALSYQKWIVLLAFLIVAAGLLKKEWRNNCWKIICILFIMAGVIAVLCGIYSCGPIVNLRRNIGGVAVWLQLDRIYWLYPALWYACLGICIQWLSGIGKRLFVCIGAGVYIVTACMVLLAGNWKDNVKYLAGADNGLISWNDFYAEDVFLQVEKYIYENFGQSKDEYRVVSLGIYPAAALYNGFYCLDGYSNNYPLEYKHKFRRIIEPELQKSDYLTEYFDEWGNRCFLFASQIPAYYTVEKGGFYFSDFEMNTDAFEEMGGNYVLSAAYIDNAEKTGLKLLREEPFETVDSYYKIYLYGLNR